VADTFSSSLSVSARRYAAALFDVAKETSSVDDVAKNMDSLASLLEESDDFRRFVASPLYTAETQKRVIESLAKAAGVEIKKGRVAKSDASGVLGNFLIVLAEHRRLNILPQVVKAFAGLAAEERGDVSVTVTSAEELTAEQEKDLQNLLAEMAEKNKAYGKFLAGKKRILHKRVNPALLGGFIVRCGSLSIDTSLRSKLSSLKLALKEVG